jgi:uncharacterized repeat protein (TIGR01451 family)
MFISRVLMSSMLLALLSGYSVAAQAAAGAVSVKSEAFIETEVKGDDGKARLVRQAPTKATPGTVVLFVNTATNTSKKVVSGIMLNNPIPAHTEYQVGSAYGADTEMTFSVNGGKSFALPDELRVKAADGTLQLAKASDYTHVRWAYKNALAPTEAVEVGFRALIK